MPLVFFFYGLAFFTMGVALLARASSLAQDEAGRRFALLGGFAITHSANERA